MHLGAISIKNYRRFDDLRALPMERITAFIGPNDAGKSSVLLLLQHCLKNEPIPADDFRDATRPAIVELSFRVDRAHEAERAQAFMCGAHELSVRKTFVPGRPPTTEVFCESYTEERLNRLASLSMAELIGLLETLAIPDRPRSNDERKQLIRDHIAAHPQPRQQAWMPVTTQLDDILPEFILFGAAGDMSIQVPITATLRLAYRRFLEEDQPEELQQLLAKAKERVRGAIAEIDPVLTRFAPGVAGLAIDPALNIENSLSIGDVRVRQTAGEARPFASFGDGTKRRMMLALFHWSNNILSALIDEQERSLIWGFDEPDTHLHYQAQYELLAYLKQLAAEKMQILICTHSIPLIDRLPARAVRQMLPSGDTTVIEYLRAEGGDGAEASTEAFLQSVGQGIGFPNSLLFYERCFILVEGPTEEKALPILYRLLYNADPIEDGVRIFSGESSGSTMLLARLLHANRKEIVILLDRDMEDDPTQAAHLDHLRAAGFDVGRRVVYIGAREFEDAFPNEALQVCLDGHYPRVDGAPWSGEEIDRHRDAVTAGDDGTKFSHDFLEVAVGRAARKRLAKPEFGRKLAESIGEERLIPAEIRHLLRIVRSVAESVEDRSSREGGTT